MERPLFTSTRWREGYNRDEVDAAVDQVLAGGLNAEEVRALVFRPVRNGPGYDMGEVDDWLDGAYASRGGRPVVGPAEAPWPPPDLVAELDRQQRVSSDRFRAAILISVTVGVAVWLYLTRY